MNEGFAPGERIGNYAVESELTRGPNGIVYRARHVVLPRRVTIRVMHGVQVWQRPLAVQMMREACFLEAMQHAGVPRVFECGVLGDKRTWIATEAIDGTAVTELIARGPLPYDQVAAMIADVADVLEHAHRRGVVHRALRPGAIVYATDRSAPLCILDWSDARAHDSSPAIPRVITPMSRAYAAPELVRGQTIDDRADIYALGAVAYQALTGRIPGDSAHPSVQTLCPQVPPMLAALVEQMLAQHAGDRPNAAEVRATADIARLPTPVALPPLRLGKLATGATAAATVARVTDTARPMPRFASPRWTPPIGSITSEQTKVVKGEIGIDSVLTLPIDPRR